jgi:hypothetical protein
MQNTLTLKVTGGLLEFIWLPRERTSIDCVPIPEHRDLAVRARPHAHIYRARGYRRMAGGHRGHVHLKMLTGQSWMKEEDVHAVGICAIFGGINVTDRWCLQNVEPRPMQWGKLLISMVMVRSCWRARFQRRVGLGICKWQGQIAIEQVSVEFSSYRWIFIIGREVLRPDLYNGSASFCWRWRQRYADIRK